jgi:hypothetical protein
VIGKSRLSMALALTLALGVGGIAYAGGTGAAENEARVVGKVSPKKLEKKKFKKVNLFTGVETDANVDGSQENPAAEKISFGKNIKFKTGAAPVCTSALPNGTTTDQARDACPAKSFLGEGTATVQAPVDPPGLIDDVVVSAFNGPLKNQLRLHTYSPTLGVASPTVQGFIINANEGKKYKKALFVPEAPETGSLMITSFNTKIKKKSGVVRARCKAKKFFWKREVTYTDNSTETATLSQKCKRKKKK